MRRIWQDVHYAFRTLAKRPLFTGGVVLILGLGIGINAVMFSIVDTLFLKPPAGVSDPKGLVRVYINFPELRQTGSAMSYPAFTDLRDHVQGFSAFAAVFLTPMGFGRGVDAAQVNGMAVSYQFFPMLRLRPVLGRFFDSTDDRVGAEKVAVLSYGFWQRHFGGDPRVIGRPIALGAGSYTVIGVAPRGFRGIGLTAADLFMPIAAAAADLVSPDATTNRGWSWLSVIGRLAPGVSPERGAAAATAGRRAVLRQTMRRPDTTSTIVLGPIQAARSPMASSDAKVSAWIDGLALMVLLIACANVANLLLARGVARRRELAVRASLGAGRAGLMRTLLAETAVLTVGGGLLAVLLNLWVGGAVRALLLPDVSPDLPMFDTGVLLFTIGAVAVTVLLVGIVPAVQASRADLVGALRSGGHGTTTRASVTQTTLLGSQIALTLPLLVGAGLFVRSLRNVQAIDLGFDAEHLLAVQVYLQQSGMPRSDATALNLQLVDHLKHLPGVENAAAAMGTPFGWTYSTDIRAQGRDSMPKLASGYPSYEAVTPSFLATMGTRILRGRDFNDHDGQGGPPVAIVGATFARLVWPGVDPVGKCLYIGGDSVGTCTAVVGVAADAAQGAVTGGENLLYYVPLGQWNEPEISQLFVRTRGPSATMVGAVRRELNAVPDLPYADIEPMANEITPQLWSWKLGAAVFTAFGLLALLIAATGIFAVLSCVVGHRTKEVGVRLALGAQPGDVIRLMVGQGLRPVVAGVALGVLVAWAVGRAMTSLLYQVSPSNAAVFALTVFVVLTTALVAAYLPARRASRVDPMIAMRAE